MGRFCCKMRQYFLFDICNPRITNVNRIFDKNLDLWILKNVYKYNRFTKHLSMLAFANIL